MVCVRVRVFDEVALRSVSAGPLSRAARLGAWVGACAVCTLGVGGWWDGGRRCLVVCVECAVLYSRQSEICTDLQKLKEKYPSKS